MTRTVKDKVDFEHMLKELGESTQIERGDTIYQPGSPSNSVYFVEVGRS
jgi:CRP-like cAMP-binding protein